MHLTFFYLNKKFPLSFSYQRITHTTLDPSDNFTFIFIWEESCSQFFLITFYTETLTSLQYISFHTAWINSVFMWCSLLFYSKQFPFINNSHIFCWFSLFQKNVLLIIPKIHCAHHYQFYYHLLFLWVLILYTCCYCIKTFYKLKHMTMNSAAQQIKV